MDNQNNNNNKNNTTNNENNINIINLIEIPAQTSSFDKVIELLTSWGLENLISDFAGMYIHILTFLFLYLHTHINNKSKKYSRIY